MAARSPIFDNVDPGLLRAIQTVSGTYKPHKVGITSGFRAGDKRQHGKGNALDVQLTDPNTGEALRNYQDPSTAQAYQAYANEVYKWAQQNDPALAAKIRWGGYFSGGPGDYGALDLMHFDTAGDIGMAGGSWAEGWTPDMLKTWGIGRQGGLPAEYTAEQRRNAIASIESAGSGDYGALGSVVNRQGDRAYGRYQVMASNIGAWTKEVLGREYTPDEFLKDKNAQDAVFDAKFGAYVKQFGEGGAAQAWFSGPGNVGKESAADLHGTNNKSYQERYLAALGAGTTQGSPAVVPEETMTAPPPVPKPRDGGTPGTWDEKLGAAIGSIGKGGASTRQGGARIAAPAATGFTTGAPLTSGAIPEEVAFRRKELADVMARLQSGKLF